MARVTHVYGIDHVAKMIGESLELIEVVSWNSDNIDYGEMIHVHDGTEEGITTFTDRGVESLQEFLADVRTWDGGIRQFLIDQQCEPDVIEHIMANRARDLMPHGLRRMVTLTSFGFVRKSRISRRQNASRKVRNRRFCLGGGFLTFWSFLCSFSRIGIGGYLPTPFLFGFSTFSGFLCFSGFCAFQPSGASCRPTIRGLFFRLIDLFGLLTFLS